MAEPVTNPLIIKLEKRDRLTTEERELLGRSIHRIKDYKPGEDVIRQGDRPSDSTLILEGFAARRRGLPGGSQQITAIHIPGDFVDLHGFLLKVMDHSITALSPCKIALFKHDTIREITEKFPHLTRLFWLSTVIDGAIHREWITVVGSRPAVGKVAHLLCEMNLRLTTAGLAEGNAFHFPLKQSEIGEALGLSTVHVNRVIQSLRKQGVITWKGDLVTILRWDRLMEIGEFEASYLNLFFEPR